MSDTAYGEEEGSEVTNLDKIRSIPLLQEIIAWNPDGNFDDISALAMLMVYREDRIQYKKTLRDKQVASITADPFFQRHVDPTTNGYSNKSIMDFIRTEKTKIS